MEPLNGFQANVAPSEAAGLPAACLVKRLACAGVGRAAKHGCGLRRQVPCRRRLHNPQRPQGGRTTECVELPRFAQAAKRHVDAVYLIRGAGSTRARRALCLPGRGLRRQVPCRRRLHNPQRPQELLASLSFSCAGVVSCAGVGHAAKRGVAKAPRPAAHTRVGQARVDVVCKQAAELSVSGAALAWGFNEGPCAWRARTSTRLLVLGVHPPPAGAGPPYYPYAKVISSARKDLQGSLCLACTPPQPGQVPAITRMQKLSAAQEAPYKKSFCAACTPPQPGQVPAITRMQKLSTVHKPTPTWKRCTV